MVLRKPPTGVSRTGIDNTRSSGYGFVLTRTGVPSALAFILVLLFISPTSFGDDKSSISIVDYLPVTDKRMACLSRDSDKDITVLAPYLGIAASMVPDCALNGSIDMSLRLARSVRQHHDYSSLSDDEKIRFEQIVWTLSILEDRRHDPSRPVVEKLRSATHSGLRDLGYFADPDYAYSVPDISTIRNALRDYLRARGIEHTGHIDPLVAAMVFQSSVSSNNGFPDPFIHE